MPCQGLSSAPRLTAESRARLVMTVRICPLVATPPWRSNNSSRPSAMTAIVGSDPGGRYRVDAVLWRKHRLGTVPLAERPRNAGNGGVSRCRHGRSQVSRGALFDEVDEHPHPHRQCPLVEVERRLMQVELRALPTPHPEPGHRAGDL